MGVMACSRDGCREILCRTLILEGSRYICNNCLEELKQVKATWPENTSVGDVRSNIEAFLQTRKGSQFPSTRSEDVDEEFCRLIGLMNTR